MGRRGCRRRLLGNVVVGAVIGAGFIWLLLFGAVVDAAGMKNGWSSEGEVRAKLVARRESDLNYASKRRVPKGPDPIHNRYIIVETSSAQHNEVYIYIQI